MMVIPPKTGRWTASCKASIVNDVHAARISFDDVTRMGISWEEFLGWEYAMERKDMDRLRTTKIQRFRRNK